MTEKEKNNNIEPEKKNQIKPQEEAPKVESKEAPKKPQAPRAEVGRQKLEPELPPERVVKLSRVSKVVKGGKNFSFSAMVVAGDGNGHVGFGLGKSNEVVEAIKKGTSEARKTYVKVNLDGDTIPHEVIGRFKASRVILKPASPGTGVIAGASVRALCDSVGIKNILTKSLGSRNPVNVVRATMDGFKRLRLERRK